MRKADLIGKTVVAVEEAIKLGTVDDVSFAQNGDLHALIIRRGWPAASMAVLIPEVLALGPDAITVTEKAALQALKQLPMFHGLPTLRSTLNSRVITLGGRLVGTVDDLLVDESTRRVIGFELRRANVVGVLIDEIKGDKLTIPYIGRLRYGKEAVVVPSSLIGEKPLTALEARIESQWLDGELASPEHGGVPELPVPEPVEAQPAAMPNGSSQQIHVTDVQ